MSSIGTGYDLSVTSYSPEGRLFQIEYAEKAVKNSGTAIAICCKDGVVFGVENVRVSKLLEKDSNTRICTVDSHIGLCSAGWQPDANRMVFKAKKEGASYKNFYGSNIPPKLLCDKLSSFVQMYTMYWHLRPFGCSCLVGGFSKDGPELFLVEPSGKSWGYYASAVGKGVTASRSELEKLKLKEIKCRDAVKEIARIIYKTHDFVKDKAFDLELSWVSIESGKYHKAVPEQLKQEAIEYAKRKKKEDEEGSSSEEEDEDEKMEDEKKETTEKK